MVITLASRANSSDKGSRLLDPTVAQRPSTTATLACKALGAYSITSTPALARACSTGRAAWYCKKCSYSPCSKSRTLTPRARASSSALRKRRPGMK